jgi:hypothetical protein
MRFDFPLGNSQQVRQLAGRLRRARNRVYDLLA